MPTVTASWVRSNQLILWALLQKVLETDCGARCQALEELEKDGGYADGPCLLTMWLCLVLKKSVQTTPVADLIQNKSFYIRKAKKHFSEHSLAPHPDVLFGSSSE